MKILNYPHPALRRPVPPLTTIDKQVRIDAGTMLELMYKAEGIGLAANQVMLPYQIVVLNTTAKPENRDQEFVCINPVILERKGSVDGEEGCLSFPGLFGKVRRARTVRVQFYNLEAQLMETEVSELPARAFQHEIDHLEGSLFIDKMGTVAKLASRNTVKDFEAEYRKLQERGEIPPDAELEKMITKLIAERKAQ